MRQVTVQYSHPDEDNEFAGNLRRDGLIPLLVNGKYVTATTKDHLSQALDMTLARQAQDSARQNRHYRKSLLAAILDGLDGQPDPQDFPNDALLVFIEGLTLNGYEDADAIPYCAVRFREDAPEEPVLEVRPEARQ